MNANTIMSLNKTFDSLILVSHILDTRRKNIENPRMKTGNIFAFILKWQIFYLPFTISMLHIIFTILFSIFCIANQ